MIDLLALQATLESHPPTWQSWYTLAVLAAVLIGLARNIGPPDILLLGGMIAVGVVGIIRVDEMLAGFSNPALVTVAALFVVAAGLKETGALDSLSRHIFGKARTERGALARMSLPLLGMSAFLNNTPIVAMMIPVLSDWCRKHQISPSRLLMPLSTLAILGGICTLIGTSTNLVVNGMMIEASAGADGDARLAPMSLFEMSWVGVPLALAGVGYLFLIGRRLLPDRKDLIEQFGESSRDYLANMLVQTGCRLIGQSVEQAGLRRLPGLFLVEVERDAQVTSPVGPDFVFEAGDRLTFTGVVGNIVDLERIPGLVPDAPQPGALTAESRRNRRLCEAVVSSTSSLIGRNIRDADFRARYNAVIIAVHRGGSRLKGRVGDIVLRAGDTLLVQTGPHFARAHRNNPGFFLISTVKEARPVRHERVAVAVGLLALLVTLLIFTHLISTAIASLLVAALMIVTRCISATEARRSLQLDVLLAIGAALALGAALERSGAAATAAHAIVAGAEAMGPVAVLAAVLGMTTLTTAFVTNNAAAALMFPLAVNTAYQLGVDPRPFAIGVALAASLDFATPIGYQTNLMVYGPGGYRFADFVRVGLPLNVLLWIGATLLIPLVWPF
jgi:di/tricarboxylate transporter